MKVVSSAPVDTITGPIPLPRANNVAASGEDDCDSLAEPSTATAVPATKRYRSIAELSVCMYVVIPVIMSFNRLFSFHGLPSC